MMFEVKGKFNTAKVFSNSADEKAVGQIIELCNQDFTDGATIRIMPDYHYGAGCTIGFTANLGSKVVPNLVGVDIGCGMHVVELEKESVNVEELDKIINEKIPSGFNSHDKIYRGFDKIVQLSCYRDLKKTHIFERQIGTLGGGNHFIELDVDGEGNLYLVIHSGSRNLGKQVADFHQKIAIESCKGLGSLSELKSELILKLKKSGKNNLIQSSLRDLEKKFKNAHPQYPKQLCFVEGSEKEAYLHDMSICQQYATKNREAMANIIIGELFGKATSSFKNFETIHNYIDFKDNIIRKGAVSAYDGERLIIPMNMRDGSLLCTGKGNNDWNNSAPHGAGRLMGRGEAKRTLNMDDFSNEMKDVFSTSVMESTLDEAPMAYKSMNEIIDNIEGTVTLDKIIKPVYNYKAH